jgi:peptidoglycan/xylan/chitin deacetylase (PgdA/CDA1 family)
MTLTPVKTPKLIKSVFPGLTWNLPNGSKHIYLTFDDGPTPEITEWVIETLDCYDAKATFFCIGNNVKTHPAIYSQLLKKGHAIGNHTHNHLKGWKTKTKYYVENVIEASNLIDSKLFRPPYGRFKPKQYDSLKKLGYQTIMWSVLAIDWSKDVSPEQCSNNVISNTKSGDIVVFHDSVKAARNMQYALPRVLKHFTEKGYEFKRIPESTQ